MCSRHALASLLHIYVSELKVVCEKNAWHMCHITFASEMHNYAQLGILREHHIVLCVQLDCQNGYSSAISAKLHFLNLSIALYFRVLWPKIV